MRAENLENINLCDNNIGSEGCLALTKANWPRISSFALGNKTLTKDKVKLETKDAFI